MNRFRVAMALLVTGLVHGGYAADAAREMRGAGGVIVHLDAADGTLLEKLCREQDNRVAHALVRSVATENAIRQALHASGLHGRVTVSRWDGKTVPFVDNFVNLMICAADAPRTEVLRVVVPDGVALIGDERVVKPRPNTIDDWPQYLYDQTGNAVSNDRAVRPPLAHMQWVGGPRWSRHHETMSSVSACVSGVGKVFYILDEGSSFSPMLPSHWKLIARDAFNGTILWKRDIPRWVPNLHKLKSGPATLPRRLVVIGDRLYVTLGIEAPVSVLDTATGKTITVLNGTDGAEEIIYDGTDLFMVADVNQDKKELQQYPKFGSSQWAVRPKQIVRWDLPGGKLAWRKGFDYVAPLTLAGHRAKLYFFNGKQVMSLNKADGAEIWSSVEMPVYKSMPTFFAPKLVVQGGAVLFAGGEGFTRYGSRGKLNGLSTETGKVMWTAPNPASGYRSPEDLFVINGKAWAGDIYSHRWWGNENNATGEFTGVNVANGSVDKKINHVEAYWFHHRCHMAKATRDYLITSRTGIEFIDPETGKWTLHHWARGACLYGVMPANGMVYAPPHPCACYIGAKTFGFTALAPKGTDHIVLRETPEAQRLTTALADAPFHSSRRRADEWPVYRGNDRRGGSGAEVKTPTGCRWAVKLGNQLTPPVIAGGKAIVANKDKFAVIAFDAQTGREAWTYLPGALVDSSPTVHGGRVYFGSADGYVQCITLDTGKLIWRYQASPNATRHMYFERLEAVHPVHGSVLVMNDQVYTIAGRSMFVDGGLRFLILDAKTGKRITEHVMDDSMPGSDEQLQMNHEALNMPQALSDLLSSNGKKIFMRYQRFDLAGKRTRIDYTRKIYGKEKSCYSVSHKPAVEDQKGEDAHLFSVTGFLDDSWWHRTYWVFGKHTASGCAGHTVAGKSGAPAGRLICFDDKQIFAWGRLRRYFKWSPIYEYSLWACDHEYNRKWEVMMPILVRSMVHDGPHVYLAGPAEVDRQSKVTKMITQEQGQSLMQKQEALLAGKAGARLLQIDAKTGKITAGFTLEQAPELDAMAVAYGNIYLVTMDGALRCYGQGGNALATIGAAQIDQFNEQAPVPAPQKKAKKRSKSKPRKK